MFIWRKRKEWIKDANLWSKHVVLYVKLLLVKFNWQIEKEINQWTSHFRLRHQKILRYPSLHLAQQQKQNPSYPPWNYQFAAKNGWLEYESFPFEARLIFRCKLAVSFRDCNPSNFLDANCSRLQLLFSNPQGPPGQACPTLMESPNWDLSLPKKNRGEMPSDLLSRFFLIYHIRPKVKKSSGKKRRQLVMCICAWMVDFQLFPSHSEIPRLSGSLKSNGLYVRECAKAERIHQATSINHLTSFRFRN